MKNIEFNNYPKSVKKFLRYIKQDASLDELKNLELMLIRSIKIRKKKLRKS